MSSPYLEDILAQPAMLRAAVRNFAPDALGDLTAALHRGNFDRILVTGMGSSFNAAYPAVIRLSRGTVPVQHINTAELLHSLEGMLRPGALLWMNSQSGESAELVRLLEHPAARACAFRLAFVNDPASTLARGADLALPIHAGSEATVSTRTYVNMLAVNLLAAAHLTGDASALARDLLLAADAMEAWLADLPARVAELDARLGAFDTLFLLGRGASMSAVWNGSLICKEAAKCAFEGMHAADFRHGPLELAAPGFAALIFAGGPDTLPLNRDLALDILRCGGRALWIGPEPEADLPHLPIPAAAEAARPLVEILPMQALSLVMAARKGLEPGVFRTVHKVTAQE